VTTGTAKHKQVYLQLFSNTPDSFVSFRGLFTGIHFSLCYSPDVPWAGWTVSWARPTHGWHQKQAWPKKTLSVWQGAARLLHVSTLSSLESSSQFVTK
jgi:hypothetical protein